MNVINYEKVRKFKKKDFLKTFSHYKAFLSFLDSPQNSYKTIIITGSTGKGTTAGLVSGILTAHGFRTGCYTSPHLIDKKERIQINNKPIPSAILSKYETLVLNKIKIFNKENKSSYIPTFFEILTIIAVLYFKDKKVEYAVLEVGLGGRLDATNMSKPLLNFILPICLDHTNFLGYSLKKILKEKQEVIKKNSITVTLIKDNKLLNILQKKCKKNNSGLYSIEKEFHVILKKMKHDYIEFVYKDNVDKQLFKIPLTSYNIIENCGIAIYGLKQVIDVDLAKVYKLLLKLRFPGRFQIIPHKSRKIILDGGHNLLSILSLVKTLKILKLQELQIIFTIMCDKKAGLILKELSKVSKQLILTRINNEREFEINKLFNIARKYFKEIYLTGSVIEALNLVEGKDCLIIGSFYLIGEFLKILPKI